MQTNQNNRYLNIWRNRSNLFKLKFKYVIFPNRRHTTHTKVPETCQWLFNKITEIHKISDDLKTTFYLKMFDLCLLDFAALFCQDYSFTLANVDAKHH